MAWPEIEAQYKQVMDAAATVLKSAGFKRSGQTFRLFSDECCAIVNFQRSRGNSDEMVRFTVNLSVISARLFEIQKFRETDEFASADYSLGHVQDRIGSLMDDRQDKWWQLTQFTLADPIIAELVPVLRDRAIPYLQRFLTDQALIDFYEAGNYGGLTAHTRDRNLAQLRSAKA